MSTTIIAELAQKFGTEVRSGDLYRYNPKHFAWAKNGGLEKIGRGLWSIPMVVPKKTSAEEAREKAETIRERFSVLSILADGVAARNIRSLIVAGAPGVGKTHTLEEKLGEAKRTGKVKEVTVIKGSISAIGLYVQLWENRKAGNVILLDDIDAVFGDEEAMNLLKGALDTTKKRRISWAKVSSFLRDADIPNSFDYEGQIVFITNTNPDAVIERAGKMAPHMAALVSRSVFLDLCIHDAESIMIRVEQVLAESSMLEQLKLTKGQAAEIVGWMHQNLQRLRSVSLRTVIQLAGFVKTTDDWQSLARATLLKH